MTLLTIVPINFRFNQANPTKIIVVCHLSFNMFSQFNKQNILQISSLQCCSAAVTVTTAAGVFIGYTAGDVRSQDSELELMLNCAARSDNVINMFSVV